MARVSRFVLTSSTRLRAQCLVLAYCRAPSTARSWRGAEPPNCASNRSSRTAGPGLSSNMGRLLRSLPLQLLAILAAAAITIGYAVRTGVTDAKWYSSASLVFAVPVFVAVLVAPRWNVKAEPKKLEEPAAARFNKSLAYLAVTTA